MTDSSMLISQEAAPIRKKTLVKLREAIIEGRFLPGERLYEQELCKLLGVSRSPIREALRQLESEKLITNIPNKGPIVTEVTIEEARDLDDVRETLMRHVVKLFIQIADDSRIADLKESVKNMEEIFKEDFSPAYLQAGDKFFEILLQGCGNKVIRSILKSLHARLSFLRRLSLSYPGRPQQVIHDFKKIAEAIERRDTEAAVEAMSENLRSAAALVLEKLQKKAGDNIK